MFNELWAKVSARERLVAIGALVVALGVIVGMILGTKSYGGGTEFGVALPSYSLNYFTAENAGLFALLALVGAIVAMVLIYLHVAPNTNIAWPLPYVQLLLIVAAATGACALLVVLMQLIRAGGFGPEPPIFMYVADIAVVAGGALMAYAAYMDYAASKPAA